MLDAKLPRPMDSACSSYKSIVHNIACKHNRRDWTPRGSSSADIPRGKLKCRRSVTARHGKHVLSLDYGRVLSLARLLLHPGGTRII